MFEENLMDFSTIANLNSSSQPLEWRVVSLRTHVKYTGSPLYSSGVLQAKNFQSRRYPVSLDTNSTTTDNAGFALTPQTFPSPPDDRTIVGPARAPYSS